MKYIRDMNAKISMERSFRPKIGHHNLYDITNDNII